MLLKEEVAVLLCPPLPMRRVDAVVDRMEGGVLAVVASDGTRLCKAEWIMEASLLGEANLEMSPGVKMQWRVGWLRPLRKLTKIATQS